MTQHQATLTLQSHQSWINTVTEIGVSSDIITASEDRTVKLWSLNEARCIRTFCGYDAPVADIAIVDETTVLTVSGNTVKLLRITDGHVLAESSAFSDKLWSCAVLNSTMAVVGDDNGNLFKIEWDRGYITIAKTKDGAHDGFIWRIFSYGNKFASCSMDKTAKLWDATFLTLIHTFSGHESRVNCVAFDESYLVTGSEDTTIRVYDVLTAFHLTTITTHTKDVEFVSIVKNANIVVSGGKDKAIALNKLPSGNHIAKYHVGMRISSFALLNSRMIAVAGNLPYFVKIFDFPELQIVSADDEITPARNNSRGGWEMYSALLETKLASAVTRIASLEQTLMRVTDALRDAQLESTCRVAKLEMSLKRLTVTQEGDADQCCVCLEVYCAGDDVFRLPCLHVHHTECLLPSLERQREPKCPICRKPVSADDMADLPKWKWNPPTSSVSSPRSV